MTRHWVSSYSSLLGACFVYLLTYTATVTAFSVDKHTIIIMVVVTGKCVLLRVRSLTGHPRHARGPDTGAQHSIRDAGEALEQWLRG